MKKLFQLLLNVALAAVSYTDLGGKAQHRTSPDPMHPASTLRGILPLHPACGPLHTQAWITMLVFATIGALQFVPALYAPAFVLSRGVFGKVTDEATDSEKGLVKLWGGASRREVAASDRMRPHPLAPRSYLVPAPRPSPLAAGVYSFGSAGRISPAFKQAMC